MKKLYFTLVLMASFLSAKAQAFGTCAILKDLNPGTSSGLPSQKIVYKGKIYFQANTGLTANGVELWVSDGTAAGTVMLKDINVGTVNSSPTSFFIFKDKLYFQATTATEGAELWVTDGTAAGTVLFKDINPGPVGSTPTNFIEVGGKMLFRAAGDGSGNEPWISDGTAAGTVQLANINQNTAANSNSNMGEQVIYKNKAYFSAIDTLYGAELWESDGTTAGTKLVKDINPNKSNSTPLFLRVVGNNILFRATDSIGGTELWKTDGTAAGTVQLKDIFAARSPTTNVLNSGNPTQFTVLGNRLFFQAIDTTSNTELWMSDGTTAGTTKVKEINPTTGSGVNGLFATANTLYFRADDGVNGSELWKTDGTATGTVMVANINPTAGSTPQNFVAYGRKVYFNGNDGTNGLELWETDGTAAGTKLTCEFRPASGGGGPSLMDPMLGSIVGSAAGDTTGTELFIFKTALGVNTNDPSVKTFSMMAKPSVTCDQTTIEILSDANNTAQLSVTNLLGQVFLTRQITITQGIQTETVNMNYLPNGLYFLTVAVGAERSTVKIVKQ